MTPREVTAATLHVNEHRIALSVNTDVPSLIEAVTSAVHSGGAFVNVTGEHGQTYDVLVNSTTQVVLCRHVVLLELDLPDAPWELEPDFEY